MSWDWCNSGPLSSVSEAWCVRELSAEETKAEKLKKAEEEKIFRDANDAAKVVSWDEVSNSVLSFVKNSSSYVQLRKEKYFRFSSTTLKLQKYECVKNAFQLLFDCPHEVTIICYVCATPLKILQEFSIC